MYLKNSIEKYLEWKSTYTNVAGTRYQSHLQSFENFIGSDTEFESIDGDQLMKFFQFMRTRITQYNMPYKEATIAYAMIILKNFFSFWRGRGIGNINPKEIMPIRYTKTLKQVVTKEDVEDMFDVLDEQRIGSLQQKLIISMLWDTGMRISELLDMNIRDINTSKNGLHFAYVRTRKSMQYNMVAWGSKTNNLLNKYLSVRLCMDDIQSDALFVSVYKRIKSEKLTSRSVQRNIQKVAKEAMIDRVITPHSFRHGKAHHMYDQNANAIDLQAVLRHTSATTVQHYLVMNEQKYLAMAEKYLVA